MSYYSRRFTPTLILPPLEWWDPILRILLCKRHKTCCCVAATAPDPVAGTRPGPDSGGTRARPGPARTRLITVGAPLVLIVFREVRDGLRNETLATAVAAPALGR